MRGSVERLEATVYGQVQGVGFRAFTLQAARTLGLTGHVSNAPDGTVRVVAEGERPALEALLRELQRGPRWARVHRVEPRFAPATGAFTGFQIRRGEEG